jgi:hypothetical protein
LLLAVCAVAACGRAPLTLPTSTATGGGSSGTGGDLGSGGATSTGGTAGSGGSTSSGGHGGDGGSGGATSTGGTAGSGGSTSSGGVTSTGGATHSAGSGGNGGLGGAIATGGTKANGGGTGSGGVGGGIAGTTATGGTKASGGTLGTGGSSSGGAGGASCSNVQPCGGDVVGTWTVTSSCLEVTGRLDMSVFGLNCAPAPVTGSLRVTGTWIAKSNGTYSDNTTTSGSETFTLAASCLQISGTTITCDRLDPLLASGGYDAVSCTPAAGGGCTCSATVKQTGWAGAVSFDASTSGTYYIAGNVVTLDDEAKYSYCVSGSKMTWTPQSTSPTTTGTIVFQK